ncbi:MAG: hypothetical protein AAGN46_04660 [Acidobacteriota bacterium]
MDDFFSSLPRNESVEVIAASKSLDFDESLRALMQVKGVEGYAEEAEQLRVYVADPSVSARLPEMVKGKHVRPVLTGSILPLDG